MNHLIKYTGLICMIGSCSIHAAPLTNIVGNWHVDEERGQRVSDLSYYRKHGQLGSTVGVDANDPAWTTRRFDTAALHFDGVDDLVRVPYARNLEPSEVSVEVWVRSAVTAFYYVVSKSALSCHAAAYSLESQNGGLEFFVAKGDGVTAGSPNSDTGIWDGEWHHVVGTYDRNAVRLFVDGVEVGTGTPATFAIDYAAFPNKDLYIGDYDGEAACPEHQYNFFGDIDEVRIWNKALTPSEIATRYIGD